MRQVAVLVLLAFGSIIQAQMNHDMGSASMMALEKASGKTFDVYWMSQMIEHHRGALEMARSILKNGRDARVRNAAQQILEDQSREIKQLEGWLKSWYDTAPDRAQMNLMRADMQPMMEGMTHQMEGMSQNPDRRFLEAMIPHHQSAVDMARVALKKATRAALRKFAQDVIDLQSREITQYKSWLKGLK